jgi:hypothetical protein
LVHTEVRIPVAGEKVDNMAPGIKTRPWVNTNELCKMTHWLRYLAREGISRQSNGRILIYIHFRPVIQDGLEGRARLSSSH